MTELQLNLPDLFAPAIAMAANAFTNRAERRKNPKEKKQQPKAKMRQPQPRGTVAYAYTTPERAPVFKATCKFLGCSETLDVEAPGYKDSEDREVVARELINSGWSRSVFDGKCICAKHTESNPK